MAKKATLAIRRIIFTSGAAFYLRPTASLQAGLTLKSDAINQSKVSQPLRLRLASNFDRNDCKRKFR